jgi:hypothetical protein
VSSFSLVNHHEQPPSALIPVLITDPSTDPSTLCLRVCLFIPACVYDCCVCGCAGLGTLTSTAATYEGGFRGGLMSGRGKLVLACGDTYEGGFRDDMKHGA